MKKSLIFLPLAVVALAGCGSAAQAKADDVPIGIKLQNLIESYIDDNGQYTKKTTICFTEEAHKEMDKYFHNGSTQAERTTYYDDDDEALLMAEPLGSLDLKDKYTDSGYGGYRLDKDTGKIYRFVAKNTDGTFKNMFNTDYMYTKSVASYSNKTHLYDAFVNLSKLAADGYFDDKDWEYSDEHKQYTHDIKPGDGESENDDKYYPDILGFAAPMLKSNYVGSNYLHIQSIGFAERYDADANKFLSIRIYIKDVDKGKVTGDRGETTMSEARIYKGIRPVGKEDFSKAYHLSLNIGGVSKTIKMDQDPENSNQYYVKGLKLAKGDYFKVFSTDDTVLTWYNQYEHKWTNTIERTSMDDYKVSMTSNSYDVYFKTDTQKYWITAEKDVMFFKPTTGWLSDNANMAVYFYDNGEEWHLMKPTSEDGIYSFNVPSKFLGKKFIIIRANETVTKDSELNWEKKWNQSADLSHANLDVNNYLTQPSDSWNSWSPSYSSK